MKYSHLAFSAMAWIVPWACAAQAGEKLPVIFAHGLGISSSAYELLYPLKALFHDEGHPFFIADTPATGSIEERAEILNREIGKLVPTGRFHIIGHSMGGLDARLAIHKGDLGARVASLTTLATPHHGSLIADYALDRLSSPVFERLFAGNLNAARDLRPSQMNFVFNAEVKDDPRVRYFSMGFFIPEPVSAHSRVPWLWFSHEVMASGGEPDNDGMVSVESSKWGDFLGALPGDHYSETGPIPFVDGSDYLDTFRIVLKNIEKTSENRP